MSSEQQTKQEFNHQNRNLPIDDKLSNDFNDDSSFHNQPISLDTIQSPPLKQPQKQPSYHEVQISHSQDQNTIIEDKNLMHYNTIQILSSASSETPIKLKSNQTQSKQQQQHQFSSNTSQQLNIINQKQPIIPQQHEDILGYSSQRQPINDQETIPEGVKKFGSLRNIRKFKTQIQIPDNSSSSFSPFQSQQMRSSSWFVGINLDASNPKDQVISDNDESKKQQKTQAKTSNEQDFNIGSDHKLLLNHDLMKQSQNLQEKQAEFFKQQENNQQKNQSQQQKNLGLFQESPFPISSLTKVDGILSNSISQLCSHRSLNQIKSPQKCNEIQNEEEEQKEEQKNSDLINNNNSDDKQIQTESEQQQQQQQQQGDVQAQEDSSNQNQPPPPLDIPNNETDNQITELHNQIEIRVQAINSLTRLIQQKQSFSKVKYFGYYLPLCIAFFALTIHEAVNFCSSSIMIHLSFYFILSVRNFFAAIRFDRLCRLHFIVLSTYQKCSINHKYLFSLVLCLQKIYKKNDQEQKLKKEKEKKQTEIKEDLSENSQPVKEFSDKKPHSLTKMEEQNDMVKKLELHPKSDHKEKQEHPQLESNRKIINLVNESKPNEIHLQTENIDNQECQNHNKHTQGQFHFILSNKKPDQQEIEKPITQEAVVQEKDEKIEESSKKQSETIGLPVFVLLNRDLLKLFLLSMPNVSLEQNLQLFNKEKDLKLQIDETKLLDNVDQVIQVFESIMYSETTTTIDREVEFYIKYSNYQIYGKIDLLYCFLEDWYFVIYNIMMLTMDFCTDREKPAVLVFAFLYSIVLWVKIIIVTFSIAFMLVALIFFLFYKIFSYKPKPTLPSISFKDARDKILATGKSSEQEIKEAACIICYEEFTDKDLVFLSPCCLKCYHKACIGHWIEKSINCPLCRTPFKNK